MASSQDIDHVVFMRQRKRPPSPSAGTVFARVEAANVDQAGSSLSDSKIKRRPPAPPPPPIPFKDGNPPFVRGRSTYRPNTLSKPVRPVPVLPPYIGQASGTKRRSRSAPPPRFAGGSKVAAATTAIGTSAPLLRSKSGYCVMPVEMLDPFSNDRDEDEGVDLGADDLGLDDSGPTRAASTKSKSLLLKPDHSDFVLVENEFSREIPDGAGALEDERLGGTDSDDVEVMRVPTTVPGAKARKSRFGTPPATSEGTATEILSGLEDEDEMVARMNQAENMLSPKQKKQFAKEEAKNNKTLSKIIKKEGKTEKRAISFAMSELEDLQRLHKQTLKLEAKALTNHSKTLSTYTKLLSTFEEVKKKYQGLESKVVSATTQLEQADHSLLEHKERARETLEHIKEKREEVEALRKQFGVEERERVVHLGELNGEVAEGDGMARPRTVRGKSRFGGII